MNVTAVTNGLMSTEPIEARASLVGALSEAATPYITGSSVELARNVAQSLYSLSEAGWPVDAAEAENTAAEAIKHRLAHGWIKCIGSEDCARLMAAEWMAWQARTRDARWL